MAEQQSLLHFHKMPQSVCSRRVTKEDYCSTLEKSNPSLSPDSMPSSTPSREEVVAARRIKVANLRRMKKMEKRQLNNFVSGVQAVKPNFSIDQVIEDFPALRATVTTGTKKMKKNRSNKNDAFNETDHHVSFEFSKPNRLVEKSWKPKVNDPIFIDINQALHTKAEKNKVIPKKNDPGMQRNVLGGNITDSDYPQRNKGKVRPDQVKRPTKLKRQILLERNFRHNNLVGIPPEHKDLNASPEKEIVNSLIYQLPIVVPKELNLKIKSFISDTNCSNVNDQTNALLDKSVFLDADLKSNSNTLDEIPDCQPTTEMSPSLRCYPHSRKFREYCTNCLTEDVVSNVCTLLEKIAHFQDRTFSRDPIKASAKRRYVAGISQTNKYLLVKKVKLLVIAPDLERNCIKGGLDDIINSFKKEAESQGVPCVYGPGRKRLGRAVYKSTLVSCVAVLSYEGAEEQFSKVLQSLEKAKAKYDSLVCHNDESENVQNTEEKPSPTTKPSCGIKSSGEEDVYSSFLSALRKELVTEEDVVSEKELNEEKELDPTEELIPVKGMTPSERLISALTLASHETT